jgi:hypothetical protein
MRSLASIDAHDLFYCMVENIQGITIIYSLRLEISVCDLVKKNCTKYFRSEGVSDKVETCINEGK